ncbi:MAG TPA: ABC transporter permease subunit, partial [Desulfobacterales bacterium]|nr:ABC transporter permease subunit [Desulfobacterales bacterium]
MIEKRPMASWFSHIVLLLGVTMVAFPIWITFVGASHDAIRMTQAPLPLLPGDQFFVNLKAVFVHGVGNAREQSVGLMMFNSLVMAMMIAVGKIIISLLSAFAIVYFRFPLRMVFFWMIFITLMLPVEVRILPTFEVVANLGMLNNYWGLTVPLIASATATFMFRQVFLTVPDELLEAARIDGAGP